MKTARPLTDRELDGFAQTARRSKEHRAEVTKAQEHKHKAAPRMETGYKPSALAFPQMSKTK